MDIQFTEAWHSPKNKQVLFLCKEPPKTVLYYGIVQVVNVQMADSNVIVLYPDSFPLIWFPDNLSENNNQK